MKRCPRCATHKPLNAFYLQTDGRPRGWCTECLKADNAARNSSPEGRSKRRAREAARREEINARRRALYAENAERERQGKRDRYAANPDRQREHTDAWKAPRCNMRKHVHLM